MNGVTIKLAPDQLAWLARQAKAKRCSKAVIVRELIDRQRNGTASLHDRMKDLCGILDGSPDLSTRKLKGYGRD
jgi:hypothetical protein